LKKIKIHLAIYIKEYVLRKAKERRINGNSNIPPCQNIIFPKGKKSSKKKKTKILRGIYFNSINK
jgi:hypothetical protein